MLHLRKRFVVVMGDLMETAPLSQWQLKSTQLGVWPITQALSAFSEGGQPIHHAAPGFVVWSSLFSDLFSRPRRVEAGTSVLNFSHIKWKASVQSDLATSFLTTAEKLSPLTLEFKFFPPSSPLPAFTVFLPFLPPFFPSLLPSLLSSSPFPLPPFFNLLSLFMSLSSLLYFSPLSHPSSPPLPRETPILPLALISLSCAWLFPLKLMMAPSSMSWLF